MIRVIKIGGNVVDNPELLESFAKDFAAISGPKVLVHGGGVMASRMQKAMGMTPTMIDGRRVTDGETLKVVTMVYAGWCNKSITALLQANGCNALGFSGADGNAIRARRRPPVTTESGQTVDYGFVGDVKPSGVDADLIHNLIAMGLTPVFCAINHDGNGTLLNTNADTVASSIAVALSEKEEVELIYCFEKDGVLYDKDDDSSVIPEITRESFGALKAEGRVADGMLPKLSNSFNALEAGVRKVIIRHARNLSDSSGTTLSLSPEQRQ